MNETNPTIPPETAQHTPGKWVIVERLSASENHRGYRIFSPADSASLGYVADVSPRDEDGIEGMANARLIAAAPQLLAALEDALPLIRLAQYGADKARGFEFRDRLLAVEDAHRTAIAAARGEAVRS